MEKMANTKNVGFEVLTVVVIKSSISLGYNAV
jgi:hypothetical protein